MIKLCVVIAFVSLSACSSKDDMAKTTLHNEIAGKLASATDQQKACFQKCLETFKGAETKAKKTCLRRLDRLILSQKNGEPFDSNYCFGGH